MASLTAETRSLPLRRRPDLNCHEQQIGGSRFWHVRDPVSLRYFQLKPEEYAVLNLLDGTASLQTIRRQFEQRFAPQRLSSFQLQSFLATLHSSGLIVGDAPGLSASLLDRSGRERRRRIIGSLTGLLAIRFRGFDPHRVLDWLEPRTRFLFAPWCVAMCVCLMLAAGLHAGLHVATLQTRLPHFHEFFSPGNIFWLAVVLAVTKILHELGHAVACQHFGAACHEMGLMLLVFTPCLFCNVSDAWMLPRRWQRIVISAAGMYIELLLASVFLFLWWFSVPGFFNSFCLNVVIVCSVTTILFNGNPLLRYDGYYILSDTLEIPNLRQQATALVRNRISRFLLDVELSNQRLLPDRRHILLTTWYLASVAYRIVVIWGILWFVYEVLEPYGLRVLANALAVATITGMLLGPVLEFSSLLSNPFWRTNVNWIRFCLRLFVVIGVAGGVLMVPLPYQVDAPVVIQAEGGRTVFVHHTGRLLESVDSGAEVVANAKLGRLSNPELERMIVRIEGDVTRIERELANLEARRVRDPESVSALIPTARKRLQEKQDELQQRKRDFDKLTIRAPIAGTVLPPREHLPDESEGALTGWSGTPLDKHNLGATLLTGTEFCQLSPSNEFEAILAIDEDGIQFVEKGQRVELLIDHRASMTMTGVITDIAEIDLDLAPPELIQHDDFPTRPAEDGSLKPVTTAYQARVKLDDAQSDLVLRGSGRARVDAVPQSLGKRLVRFFRRTFRLK